MVSKCDQFMLWVGICWRQQVHLAVCFTDDGHNISVQYLEGRDSRLGSLRTRRLKHEIVFCGGFHSELLKGLKCLLHFDILKTWLVANEKSPKVRTWGRQSICWWGPIATPLKKHHTVSQKTITLKKHRTAFKKPSHHPSKTKALSHQPKKTWCYRATWWCHPTLTPKKMIAGAWWNVSQVPKPAPRETS